MNIYLLFAVFVSSILTTALGNSRSGFGEGCNATIKCNKSAWLTCRENVCKCSRPNEMVYDPAQKSCVVSAGERCRIAIGEDEDGGYMRFDVMKCVNNAACVTEGVCKCGPGFFETPEGLCSLKKGYLSSCNSTNECTEREELTCINGICTCDPKVAAYVRDGTNYDRYGNNYGTMFTQCAGLPGKRCLKSRCVANSQCNSNDVCECKSSYTPSAQGCLPGYGHACTQEAPCASSLNCIEGVCRCKYPKSQYIEYNASPKRCVSFDGGPCDSNNGCAPNTECINVGSYSRCECKSGYIRSAEGLCDIDYGNACPVSPTTLNYYPLTLSVPYRDIARHDFTEKCNRAVPLTCVNGMCNCPDSGMVYDSGRVKCVWLVGFECDEVKNYCVTNSYCGHEKPGIPTRCICSPGYTTDTDRTCVEVDDEPFDQELTPPGEEGNSTESF